MAVWPPPPGSMARLRTWYRPRAKGTRRGVSVVALLGGTAEPRAAGSLRPPSRRPAHDVGDDLRRRVGIEDLGFQPVGQFLGRWRTMLDRRDEPGRDPGDRVLAGVGPPCRVAGRGGDERLQSSDAFGDLGDEPLQKSIGLPPRDGDEVIGLPGGEIGVDPLYAHGINEFPLFESANVLWQKVRLAESPIEPRANISARHAEPTDAVVQRLCRELDEDPALRKLSDEGLRP